MILWSEADSPLTRFSTDKPRLRSNRMGAMGNKEETALINNTYIVRGDAALPNFDL